MYCRYSGITVTGKSSVTFNDNHAINYGGRILFDYSSNINQGTTFTGNNAGFGGAIYSKQYSYVKFGGNSVVAYLDNFAVRDGGAVLSHNNSNITFDGNTVVSFDRNFACNGITTISRNV